MEGAAESAVRGTLAVVRGAIDLYVTEHIGDPPPNFGHLYWYTDVNGNISAVKVSPFIYGPYLRALLNNPYNDDAFFTMVTTAEAAARTVVGSAGRAYNEGSSGADPVFYANSDTAGVGENDF